MGRHNNKETYQYMNTVNNMYVDIYKEDTLTYIYQKINGVTYWQGRGYELS